MLIFSVGVDVDVAEFVYQIYGKFDHLQLPTMQKVNYPAPRYWLHKLHISDVLNWWINLLFAHKPPKHLA